MQYNCYALDNYILHIILTHVRPGYLVKTIGAELHAQCTLHKSMRSVLIRIDGFHQHDVALLWPILSSITLFLYQIYWGRGTGLQHLGWDYILVHILKQV